MPRHTDTLDPATLRFAQALTDPCLIVDARTWLHFANSAAIRLFADLRLAAPLALSLRNPALLGLLQSAIADTAHRTAELSMTSPQQLHFRANVSPLPPLGDVRNGPVPLFVIHLVDQTEQFRLDRMRSDFVANASHELRTPLTALIGFIETLAGPAANDPPAQAKFLAIMRTQAERMSNLVDDLLSLSRIEMRQHLPPSGTVNLNHLAREVVEAMRHRANEAGLAIKFVPAAGRPQVTGDRAELHQAIENLLDNALKYGAGGNRIEVTVGASGEFSRTEYEIAVTDHGAGVAADHVPRLTERFYRVDTGASQTGKGTGLGLAIVKHIVSRHRGEMTIVSTPGQGMRVGVHLPGQNAGSQETSNK
ncbi:MAG: hypothetical protein GXP01_07805 [Alphaproteobacteria bacterium]|nr:hypothetical protein [Alphaproteobacteria bacterium]